MTSSRTACGDGAASRKKMSVNSISHMDAGCMPLEDDNGGERKHEEFTTNVASASPEATSPPVVGFVGFSKSGKTTVMSSVIAHLTACGYRVGAIKHDVHGFSMDHPGKDTWRLKQAGAAATIISSPHGIGMVMDTDRDTPLDVLLEKLSGMDVVLFEGYKRTRLPKIEVYRPENGTPPACKGDAWLIAVVSDADLNWDVPRFSASDTDGIADFIISRVIQRKSAGIMAG